MNKSEQERAFFRFAGKEVKDGSGLRSELILLNAEFEAARTGRAGEMFALSIAEARRRLVSLRSWSSRERT